MDYPDKIYGKLNEEQRRAVLCEDGPALILAGAGSGKTRVLTHRVVHLIHQGKADPTQILSVTFTNKAAAEMRHRVLNLLGGSYDLGREMWLNTFHSACVRILRSDIHHLGYSNSFTIYDDSDQLSLVKACMKELSIGDQSISPKAIQSRINKLKNDGIDHESYAPTYTGHFEDAFERVFKRYGEALKACSATDFADLILLTVNLWKKFPNVLANYRKRFKYLLIDEYQDTNACQYKFMKLLAGQEGNIFAVGDEDQSIYKWRGADISNILNFEKDFPTAQIYKLEQNYRSTKNIIEAASHVIAHNTERRDKQLWTENDSGEKIGLIEAYDESDEAQKVVQEVATAMSDGYDLQQMAIFYRTNAQSRKLEDMMRAKGVNYDIYGGLKFYDRLEIKDALAYMKLLANPADDVSFRRIINVPARGIGAVSLERFSTEARRHGLGHFAFLEAVCGRNAEINFDFGRSRKNFKQFYDLIAGLQLNKATLLPSDLLNVILEESNYRKSLADEHTVESQSRLENLAELRQSIVEFEVRSGGEDPTKAITLERFLEEIALVSDFDRFDHDAPSIKMMTVHAAKGLEFDVVFIVGCEEELMPNVRPWEPEEPGDVEEERRLFYVAMTRARKRLRLLFCKNRMVFGNTGFRIMSRFIEEIPEEYKDLKKSDFFNRGRDFAERTLPIRHKVEEQAYEEFSQLDTSDDMNQDDSYDDERPQKGSRVVHPTFGEGVVRQLLGQDKVMVEFPGRGLKKLSIKFTQLKY